MSTIFIIRNTRVYVGKANNLKKRVAQHFSGHKITSQRQNFLRDVYAISFEICATEFMALLLECCEIKKLWPVHNRALKKFDPKFGLYHYQARNGYVYLGIGKLTRQHTYIEMFYSLHQGIDLLLKLSEQFGIDKRFCNYGTSQQEIIPVRNLNNLPDIEMHNSSIDQALDFINASRSSFGIIDKGRNNEERSCIWIEKGHFYGMGYIASDLSFSEACEIKDYVTPYKSNQYIMQLITTFADKYPGKVIRQAAIAH